MYSIELFTHILKFCFISSQLIDRGSYGWFGPWPLSTKYMESLY